ncbi:MAG: hypothetical protein AB9836_11275 [Aminipila sp.]
MTGVAPEISGVALKVLDGAFKVVCDVNSEKDGLQVVSRKNDLL